MLSNPVCRVSIFERQSKFFFRCVRFSKAFFKLPAILKHERCVKPFIVKPLTKTHAFLAPRSESEQIDFRFSRFCATFFSRRCSESSHCPRPLPQRHTSRRRLNFIRTYLYIFTTIVNEKLSPRFRITLGYNNIYVYRWTRKPNPIRGTDPIILSRKLKRYRPHHRRVPE